MGGNLRQGMMLVATGVAAWVVASAPAGSEPQKVLVSPPTVPPVCLKTVGCATPTPNILKVQPGGPLQGSLIVRGPATVYFIPTNPFAPWYITKNNTVVNASPISFGTNTFTPIGPYESLIPNSTPVPAGQQNQAQPPTGTQQSAASALSALILPGLNQSALSPGSIGCTPAAIPHNDAKTFDDCLTKYSSAVQDVVKLASQDDAAYRNANHELRALRSLLGNLPSPRDVTYDDYRSRVSGSIIPQKYQVLAAMSAVRPLPGGDADSINVGLQNLASYLKNNTGLYRPTGTCKKKCVENAAERWRMQNDQIKADASVLAKYLSTSDYSKSFAAGYSIIENTMVPALINTNLDQFAFADTEDCKGTNAGGRVTTYVLGQLNAPTQVVTVVCRPRVFVSTGFAFSSLRQATFIGVPVNLALVPTPSPAPAGQTPAPLPTQYATIGRSTSSDVRPIPMAMVNVSLFGPEADDTLPGSLYGSFGVALSSGSASTVIDYVGGLSYGLSRTVLFTLGWHLGDVTELANGYHEGDIIPSGTNPQTQTRMRLGYFVGITFGRQ